MGESEDLLSNAPEHAARSQPSGPSAAPARHLAVVACMDARLDLFAILALKPGDAHIIRNAGGIVTDDTIRSLVLSQQLLGTREVILIHHTDCGLHGRTDEEIATTVEKSTGTRPSFPFLTFTDTTGSVRSSMTRLSESPLIVSDHLRGFVYDVETGHLNAVDP